MNILHIDGMFVVCETCRMHTKEKLAVWRFAVALACAGLWLAGGTPCEGVAETDEQSAQALLDLLVTDDSTVRECVFQLRPTYMEAVALARQGDAPLQAVAAYERHLLAKFRAGSANGLPRPDLLFAPPDLAPGDAIREADRLLAGTITLDGKDIPLGPPGAVNWNYPFPPDAPIPAERSPHEALYTGFGVSPLLEAYLWTHNARYLEAWSAYMDDWARRSAYLDGLHPCAIPSAVNSRSLASALRFTRLLWRLAAAAPDDPLPIPPATFARVLRKYLVDFPLPTLVYIRSNTHNWTPFPGLIELALHYDEFRFAPVYFREGRRRHVEDNAVTQNLRDGSENQQCPWYNENYIVGMARLLGILDGRDAIPVWKELPWVADLSRNIDLRNEIREHLRDHVTCQIHLRTPQNEWPIPFRGGDKRQAGTASYCQSPEAYADPGNAAILAAVQRPGSGRQPAFDSEWFPYGGYNIVRDGWSPDTACGALFCSPQPGAYGAYRSRSNNNTFGLAAHGQDLLVDDTTGHYMYPSSPLVIDGLNQFFHARDGVYKVGGAASHKSYLVSAWTDPAPWRWHASDRFNLMEGVYDGPYAALPSATGVQGAYGPEEAGQITLAPDRAPLRAVHQRLVLHVRGAGLWIVTDRVRAGEGTHAYEQVWMLPVLPGPYPAFEPDQIRTDEAGKRVFTLADKVVLRSRPTEKGVEVPKANVSLHQFTDAALEYAVSQHPRAPISDGRVLMYGWVRVGGRWTGTGSQQVVTAVYPQAPGLGPAGDLKAVKALRSGRAARGFEAVTPSGVSVRYLATPDGADELDLGDVRARGEALMICGNSGIALGCTELAIDGQPAPVVSPDFEFTRPETGHQTPAMLPIYRPIDPVTIGPARNVFMDSVLVTMTSRTPGVVIHYTLDGSDPTPRSASYDSPFPLTGSAVIKARAFRPGVTSVPLVTSGTHATPVSRAVFERMAPIEAVEVKAAAPGLDYRYAEDDWRRLWLQWPNIPSLAEGVVTRLWDWSLIPAGNPPVATNALPRERSFAVEYTGFLEVPADGVYTLHAPREWVMPDTDAGYDLQVGLGNRLIPHGYRTRVAGLNTWYPSTRLHALGNWSVALRKGLHPLRVFYLDYRTRAPSGLNRPGLRDYIWSGTTPDLRISGPGIENQPVPEAWLRHAAGKVRP